MADYFEMNLKEQIEELMKICGREVNLNEENSKYLIKFTGITAYLITYKCMEKFGEITVKSLVSVVQNTFTDSIDEIMISQGQKIIDLNKNKPERINGVVVDVCRLIKETGFPWYGIKNEDAILMFSGMIQSIIEDILDREDGSNLINTIKNDRGYQSFWSKILFQFILELPDSADAKSKNEI